MTNDQNFNGWRHFFCWNEFFHTLFWLCDCNARLLTEYDISTFFWFLDKRVASLFFTNVCLICRLGRQFGRKWLLEWERPRGQSGPSSLLVPIPAPERGNPKHLLHRNPSPEHPGFAESCRRKCPPPWEATEHWEK